MKRRLTLAIALALLASLSLPGGVKAESNWNVSTSTDQVKASLISSSVSDARLALENNVSITPFGIPLAGEILNALGFGGGYSQEAKWANGSGPLVSCPEALADLPLTCRDSDAGGTVLIPDGQRAELSLVAPAATSDNTLTVGPDLTSVAYDGAVAAIGLALQVVEPGPFSATATQVASEALDLLPEAGGYAAAMERGDKQAAFNELLALSERAMDVIDDNPSAWGLAAINLIPGVAEFDLGLGCAKAIAVLANLDAHLLSGNANTTVTVGYGQAAPIASKSIAPLTSLAWTSVPAGQLSSLPSVSPGGYGPNTMLEGWSKGYVEFVWDPQARTLTPWTSTDGIAWQRRSGVDLGVWSADLATYDRQNPGSANHDDCTFTLTGFQEGLTNLSCGERSIAAAGAADPS